MTKVLLITSEFPPQPGGIGTHAHAVAIHLTDNGYQVTVSCDQRSENGEEETTFDKEQPFIIKRTKRKKPLLRTYSNRLSKAKKLSKKADIILVSGKFSLWIGGYLKRSSKNKVIAIVHGTELLLKNPTLKRFTKRNLLKMDACISVSNYTASLLKSLTGLDSTVMANGYSFSSEITSINKTDSDSLKLITVGNVTQRKGQHNVIKSLPLLQEKYTDFKYQMVGIPTNKESLMTLAQKLNVADKIEFTGRISEAKKIELLQQASIFTMLSETTTTGDVEGFGIAILEANALGVPAIGAKYCGIEDAIEDGYSGILVDPHRPEEFTKAVTTIMNDYKTYSKNAKDWASRFTWGKLIKAYIRIIEGL